ncbi:MAG TPA: nuclease-related domain-containing protein [Phnomibacter sp.]|nr:nuclease-related domain-containing protein [Phnomibacter sp.]
MNEVISFQNNFSAFKNQIIKNHELQIEKEKETLVEEISQLEDSLKRNKAYFENLYSGEIEELKQKIISLSVQPSSNLIKCLITFIKSWNWKRKLQKLESCKPENVNAAINDLVSQHLAKVNRLNFITLHFADAVNESSLTDLQQLDYKKQVIDEVKSFIYGALGEHKVEKELKKLSDENFLINDFNLSFYPAIYFKQQQEHIKSIQIDHLLVTPAGVFIIETKNWSEKSVASLDLHSPVQQIRRSSFALFKKLTGDISAGRLRLQLHHWGDRIVPIRNLIVLTNVKVPGEFQNVKILAVSELLSYIGYFKPIFTNEDTQTITNYLLNLCE